MRANRKIREQSDAQVGIGTMIVFIATVLVAAIAAGVLIDTSGKLQERSSRTGDQATQQVASNLHVERIVGERDGSTSSDNINNLSLYVSLAPGANKVDLAQLDIQLSNGAWLVSVDYTDTDPNLADATGFAVFQIRDADDSIEDSILTSADKMTMTAGDLVRIQINLHPTLGLNKALGVRTPVTLTLMPEVGSLISSDFTTPESYGSDTYIDL